MDALSALSKHIQLIVYKYLFDYRYCNVVEQYRITCGLLQDHRVFFIICRTSSGSNEFVTYNHRNLHPAFVGNYSIYDLIHNDRLKNRLNNICLPHKYYFSSGKNCFFGFK